MLQKLKAIRLSEQSIQCFRSSLCDQIFLVETENKLSDFGKISGGIFYGFNLGLLLFLIYLNDMLQAVKLNLLLYFDDSCLMYQHNDIAEIEKMLNNDFENNCDWFIDNKVSIHFGDDKIKSILFVSKQGLKMFVN